MIEKSDAMKQHEKWIEETLKHQPKTKKEGLPIQPWHGLAFLLALLALSIVIGQVLHN